MLTPTQVRAVLKEAFERAADYRRARDREWPLDARNSEAARLLDALTASVDEIPDQNASQLAQMWDANNVAPSIDPCLNEHLRRVGLVNAPASAADFVIGLLSGLAGDGET